MDIKCSKCGMEYSLDDTLISGSGTSVRCMNCNQVFKVYKPGARGQDEWVLRQAHGPFRTIDNLGVLQQWIQAGKISPDDLLSKKNGQWKKVGDIEQLKPFFKKARPRSPSLGPLESAPPEPRGTAPRGVSRTRDVDSTEKFAALKQTPVVVGRTLPKKNTGPAKKTDSAKPAAKMVVNDKPTLPPPPMTADVSLPSGPGESEDSEVTKIFSNPGQVASSLASEEKSGPYHTDASDFSSIPAAKEDERWEAGEEAASVDPAWAERSGALPRYEAEMDSLPPPKRGAGKWLVLGALLVGCGVAALFFFWPEKKDELLSTVGEMVSSPEAARYRKFFDRGRENFLLDTNTSFLQADREFQKVLALKEGDPPALAALARLYAVWAQYHRDAKLDVQADVSKKRVGAEEKNKEIEILSSSFREKLREASRWSRQALTAAPELKEALLAAADTARLAGDLEEARSLLKQAESFGADAQTEYAAVLVDLDKNALNKDAAGEKELLKRSADRLERAVGNQSMIRAIYRIARLRAAAGQKDEAKKQLAKLFALNTEHPQAKALSARIEAGKPIPIFDKAAAEAALAAESSDTETSSDPPPEKAVAKPKSSSEKDNGGEKSKSPERVYSRLRRAAALQSGGHADAAKTLYQEVLAREPSNVEALTGIGYCYRDKGNNGKALANFRRALNVDSSYGAALLGIAETYKGMGQKEESLKFYRRFLAAHPSGKKAEMARKNISRFESELGRESSGSAPSRRGRGAGEDDYVIDDSPPASSPAVEKTPEQPVSDKPKEETAAPAASAKPTIIILKKDDSSASEE